MKCLLYSEEKLLFIDTKYMVNQLGRLDAIYCFVESNLHIDAILLTVHGSVAIRN